MKEDNYQSASSSASITDGVLRGAAAGAVVAAGCRLNGAASPSKAESCILKHAAACGSRRARVVLITHG